MADIVVDGLDLATIGVTTRDVRGFRSGIRKAYKSASMPGGPGHVPLSSRGQGQPSTFQQHMMLVGSTNAAMRTFRDQLMDVVYDRVVQLQMPDEVTRHVNARITFPNGIQVPPAFIQNWQRFIMAFTLLDGSAYTTTANVEAFTGTDTDMPTGSGDAKPVITLNTPTAAVDLVYKDEAGVEQARMVLAGITGTTVIVDCLRSRILEDGVPNPNLLAPGSDYIVFRHTHAVLATSSWGTLAWANGSAASADATYNRAWY